MSGTRPEHIAPPEVFYNASEAQKYTANTRVQSIQAEMTYRCLELLDLPCSSMDQEMPRPSFLLDIGAGSGLSGEILSEEGHQWVGMDVSGGMLEVALERDVEGDLMLADIGQGIPYRPGSFDGAISVSVLQWLCNADSTAHSPAGRLLRFFTDLFGCLTKGSRAVFQFYPESDEQIKFIMGQATRAGFGGGLKKFYLILFAGQPLVGGKPQPISVPQGLTDDGTGSTVQYERKRADADVRKKMRRKGGKNAGGESTKEFIMRKKELYRKKGKKEVPRDSKYTARSRKPRF
ncbi:hypothetical protein JCM11641_001308 [Rhodosporidiobolus odoratus]